MKMEQAPSLDMVYVAVSALYNNPNCAEKEKASQWLGDLQKSVFSWKIADDLLHQKRDLESCYFAAQTMRTKIQLSFHELPLEAHNSLRDSLLEHISQITESTSTIIVTQLCLALADLALQMPTWQNSVLDLVNSFSQSTLWPLLEIMTVLPEELESRSVRLGANRRAEVLEDLKRCAPTVLELLKVCLSNNGDNVQINIKVIRCFTSWVTVNAITLTDATENAVVAKAFQILRNSNVVGALHNAATDCICTLLQCLEDNNNQQTLEVYLFQSVIVLEDSYHISVANEDQEKSMNYARIFTELAETFLDKILNNSNEKQQHFAIKILDLVLISVGHHDYEVAEVSFNLWYLLSEELYQKNNKLLTEMFRPYVERLVTALARHCQMEPDHEGLLDDGDEFKDFRLKVSDLIKDVVFIVGSSTCFRQMFINLQTPGVTWDSSEAALFIMQAVAKNVLPTENEVVPKVVEAILNLPENTHVAVRFTSVLLLGELCEWVEKHPQSLEPILNFLLYCLQQGGIAAAAATALQSICTACNDHMPRHVPVLLQILENVDSFAVTNSAVIGLLKGVAAIIGCMPHQDLTIALRQLVLFQVKPIVHLLEQDIAPVKNTKTDPVFWLDRLSSIFRNVHVQLTDGETNPCREVVTEAWPVLSRLFDKYQSDIRIIERACRSIRFMLRCVSQQARHLLEPLVEQMIRLYAAYKHSSFLYLGSILVDEYATDVGCVQGLLDMLQAFIEPTFCVLKEENGLRNHPDTVDDFFRLCTRFIQRAPIPFLQCTSLPLIIQCALMSSTLEHKEANTSVMKFFYDLINCGQSEKTAPDYEMRKNLVRGLIQEHGQQLTTNLLHSSVFYLHTYMLPDVADVIVELIRLDREALGHWLETAVRMLPVQANGVIVAATPQQLQDFHVSVTRSDTSKSVTHALKEITRLYR